MMDLSGARQGLLRGFRGLVAGAMARVALPFNLRRDAFGDNFCP
ncbi:hypothetical protein ACSSV4_003119 [Roseovarius sp. MBR-154]|jgi:hypothetical protein